MAKHARPKVGKPTQTAPEAPSAVPNTVRAASGPDAAAVGLFDRGMRALQRHDYGHAAERFRELIGSFPAEGALLERARVYLDLCVRELAHEASEQTIPSTIEECLASATAALNLGKDAEAERLANAVLSNDPRQELAHYLLAAVEARRGHPENALSHLAEAIETSPEIRAQAIHDDDFEILRNTDAFKALVSGPAALL